LTPQEQERADAYALVAALLQAPDPAWLAQLAAAPAGSGADPWARLVAAARRCGQTVADEYAALFLATGNPLLNPYASWYLAGCLMDKPLAKLRQDLRTLGLARAGGVTELEDHLGALCETMHLLVRRGEPAQQQAFFERHLANWYAACLADLRSAPPANFYRAVADLAEAFLDLECELLAPDVRPLAPHTDRQPPAHETLTA
jgi:TorA maturation chaperone TorD